MYISLLQYTPTYLDRGANLDRVEQLIGAADTDLLVLPELFATGYFFRSREDLERVAEPVGDGPTTERLLAWARRSGALIVAGMPERDPAGRLFNSAVAVGPTGVIGTYRKVHLFYEEKSHFTPGDLGFPVFDVQDRSEVSYRLGIMICYDWYFPESARTLALQGADVIAHPANLVRKDCPRAMPIRALENHVYTVTANRTGTEAHGEETLRFIGQSLICDPDGAVLAAAGAEETTIVSATIEPHRARNRRITRTNDLFADRRPGSYTAAG